MKMTMVIIITVGLLFSCSVIASAEMLFGVSAETGKADFSADYSSSLSEDVLKTPNILFINGDLNLFVIHTYLEYGTADMGQYSFSTANIMAGWELGLDIFKVKVAGGYQQYLFSNDKELLIKDNSYGGLVGSLGFHSKINKFTFYGKTLIPANTHYDNGEITDNSAGLSYFNLGVAYAPVPLIDLSINYRTMKADSKIVDISTNAYTLGAKISF